MSFSSNSVIAKSRAIFGKSLSAGDFAQLCDKKSVAEAAAYLKNTPRYGEALAVVNPQTVHRGQLEALLSKTIFDLLDRFRRFDFTESKWFFKEIIIQHEAEQILCAIEAVADGSTDNYIAALPTFLLNRSRIDLLELGKSESFADISRMLAGTEFSRLLDPLLTEAAATGKINIRECERRLYTHYYISCMKMVEKSCKGAQKSELKRAFLKSIDMKNVVTCRRMKAFGFDSGSAQAQMIPFRYRLNSGAIERLMQQPDIERVEAELAGLGYRTDSHAQFQTIEQLAERISLDYLRRTLRISRSSATVYFCLIECLQIELRNIKTVIEGIRYGLNGTEIMEMLIL
ncbi:MAG: V-type ATPase subunit [Oscillospiraceae bacterium]